MARKKSYGYQMVIECEHGLGTLAKIVRAFPFEEFQELDAVTSENGMAMVTIDMHTCNKETPQQFDYLENCGGVLSYSVERKG